MGQKRAAYLNGGRLVCVADRLADRSHTLAQVYGADVTSPEALLERSDIDAVIIATSHDVLSSYAASALYAGKHVLVEKPAGRCVQDILEIRKAAHTTSKVACVGFNHR